MSRTNNTPQNPPSQNQLGVCLTTHTISLPLSGGLDVALGYKMVGALTATLVLKTGLENQYYHHLSLMGLQVGTCGYIYVCMCVFLLGWYCCSAITTCP